MDHLPEVDGRPRAEVLPAVVDAVAHLGLRHIDMPASAERVWRAIDAPDSHDVTTPAARGALNSGA